MISYGRVVVVVPVALYIKYRSEIQDVCVL